MKATISCGIRHGNIKIPDCTMLIQYPEKAVTKHLLSMCHRICRHQAAKILDMEGVQCEDLQEPCVFTLSKNTELLRITRCELPTQTLSHLMQQINGCSALQDMDLTRTKLTGCLSSFLPDPHPGLRLLHLWRTALNNEDLQHLTHLIQTHKLPGLEELHLDWLGETDVGDLIEACVTHHQRELALYLWSSHLSEESKNKWKERCRGTNIELII